MNRSLPITVACGSVITAAMMIASAPADRPVHKTPIDSAPRLVTPAPEGGIAGGTTNGPDVIVSAINSLELYGTAGDVSGYAMTTVSCNLGEADAEWFAATNHHPVIAQNLYRLKNGRFEQIGMAWLKHAFCAADLCGCGTPCEPSVGCEFLGTHAVDIYNNFLNADQTNLGPRSEVNAWTGAYPFPPLISNWGMTGDGAHKRLQVHTADIDPAQNRGALYFAEGQYVCTDEQPVNRYNNVTYGPVAVGAPSGTSWELSFSGSVNPQQPAINAWRAADGNITLTNVDTPNDGRFIVAFKATDLGGGQWHYEYAIYNMNNDRGAQAFNVPVPDSVNLSNIGFHDVDYHSGEPYALTDWPMTRAAGIASWATQTFATNFNANALRWGTLYNFRFDANAPPKFANATINLFKSEVPLSANVQIVAPTTCVADIAPAGGGGGGVGNGEVNVDDLLAVITGWGPCINPNNCPADIAPPGGDDAINVDDLLAVISGWGPCQ